MIYRECLYTPIYFNCFKIISEYWRIQHIQPGVVEMRADKKTFNRIMGILETYEGKDVERYLLDKEWDDLINGREAGEL